MLTTAQKKRYTAPALEKNSVGIGIPMNIGGYPLSERFFCVRNKSPMGSACRASSDAPFPMSRYANLQALARPDWHQVEQVFKTWHRRHIMSNISIGSSEIRCINGLYSLNDLHIASGYKNKHRPSLFINNKQTQDLLSEISKAGISALTMKKGGHNGGTFACRELVIAYAAWISPAFHLKVIRAFLDSIEPRQPDIFQNSAHSSFFPVASLEMDQHIPLAKIKKALRSIFVFALKQEGSFSNQMLFLFSITTQLETLFNGAQFISPAKFKEFNERLKKRGIDVGFLMEDAA